MTKRNADFFIQNDETTLAVDVGNQSQENFDQSLARCFQLTYRAAAEHSNANTRCAHVACSVIMDNQIKRLCTSTPKTHAEVEALFSSELWGGTNNQRVLLQCREKGLRSDGSSRT